MVDERRLTKRYRVNSRAFALLRAGPDGLLNPEAMNMGDIALAVFKSNPAKYGQIGDISMDGLSFSYIEELGRIQDSEVLDILMADIGFYLGGVAFESISDFKETDGFDVGPIKMRRSGLRFKRMTTNQKNQLKEFIRSLTQDRFKPERGIGHED
jgi:hypothetical protein